MMYILEKVAQKRDKMMNLALSEMFKECLWCYVSVRINVNAGAEV